ncbi:hypothetical protein EW145_g635 [Phellinidium pouzarii]|uniref:F-box domain-containing protein n=1 Tax=Phellinidium pouzarii TaxID=167371 RepID=A0A4S4LHM8_9AGAM|nr:hypothetical protein EW145_g635 [Phellinidium pouzarii]
MPVSPLPPELWREILDIATQDDPLLEPALLGPLAKSSWYEMVFGDWWLRRPHEALQIRQRQSYALKKAFTQTCTLFARVGAEYLYRSILVSDPRRLQKLCSVLDVNTNMGHWTKAIYIYWDERLGVRDLGSMDDCVVSLVRHCPNLQVFMVDPKIGPGSFLSIADALRTHCSASLRLIQWKITFTNQTKVVPAISSMRNLVAIQLEINYPAMEGNTSFPGIRQMLDVSFPHLKQLSLRGAVQDFAEQITMWHMPELTSLTLDFKACRHDFPDVLEVLTTHGPQLDMLDLNAIPTLDVRSILTICPNLTTFCFSLDWQLEGNLVEGPHRKLQNIGLYGLRHAFGVGFAGEVAQVNPFEAVIMRRRNDMNFIALDKNNFPSLCLIRVLEPGLLNDLNKNNGPATGISAGYSRWERWWDQCSRQRIRLEDCTGNLLGTLPQREDDLEDYESEVSDSTVD